MANDPDPTSDRDAPMGDRFDRLDVVIQDVASFRIDPAVLARPDRRLALICSPTQRARLDLRGRADVFHEIVVLDDFRPDTLAAAVAAVIDRAGVAAASTRLLCHDEYRLGAVAAVREKLDLPGDRPPQLRAFSSKLAMKAALREAGIRMPRHVAWDQDAFRADPAGYPARVLAAVGLPAFAKPIDESGSVGASRIDRVDDLVAWAGQVADSHACEVDEFVDGPLFHVDSVVVDGRIVHARANRNLHPCHEYAAGATNCSFTLPEDDPAHDRLLAFNTAVLDGLADKPRDGVFHHEMFLGVDGEPVFLEIAARAPAALIPATGRIRWGYDIEEMLFALQRGERPELPRHDGPHAAYLYYPKRLGTVTGLDRPALGSPHRWTWNVQLGDVLDDALDIRDYAASVLLWNEDPAALRRDIDLLDRSTPVRVTG